MHILHVHIRVKPECLAPFLAATRENARNSILEKGCVRFDVAQQADDPTRIVLVEAYHSPEDLAAHRETRHFQAWRDVAEPMMAEPRTRAFFKGVFPDDADW
jgi:quinol monooxygenase YgiN